MRRLAVEVSAQLFGLAKLFVSEHAFGANITEGSRQLIVMGIAPRQTVIVNKNPKLALAQRRAVEVRQVVYCRTGRVHGRLVDQMYLAEETRVTRCGARHRCEAVEEWHSRRPMLLEQCLHRIGECCDRIGLP